MASQQCPLDHESFRDSEQPMGLHHVQEIEEHIATSSNIDCPHPPLKDLVFQGSSIKGSTPLLIACHYGELVSVKRIVEHWRVDVNLPATYYADVFKGELFWCSKIEKAAPLFVAASRGHVEIVRYLVEKGADIFAKTSHPVYVKYNCLTPLYGALFDYFCYLQEQSLAEERKKRSTILRFLLESGADLTADTIEPPGARPIWMSKLCGIDAITLLVDYGLNVNQRVRLCPLDCNHRTDPTEFTILDYWIDLPHSCTEEESLVVVKYLIERGADLNVQDDNGFTPILKAAHRQNLAVLDFLLERNHISRMEKIDALELAGANILGDIKNAPLFPEAFTYWRQSLHLRLIDTDGLGPAMKTAPNNVKIGRIVEWATYEELERVLQHRSEQEIQSFLVRLRILSARSWDGVESLFRDQLNHRSSTGISSDHQNELNIWWSMLETIQDFNVREEGLWIITLTVVENLVQTLLKLERNDPLLNVETVKTSSELILATDVFHSNHLKSIDDNQLNSYTYSMFRLITMLADLPQLLDEDTIETLSELIRDSHKHKILYLHRACKAGSYNTIHLLLLTGADPNAGDDDGNGPLHVIATLNSDDDAAPRLLLDSGAHLDRVNRKKKTAADVWIENHANHGPEVIQKSVPPSWLREDDPVPKLMCLSARVIRSHGVPYWRLPPILTNFVKMH